MEELEKAYKTVDMLIELDLPISKTQIEEIWSLEKKSGNNHRADLSTYFYEKCFVHYTKRIMNIRQAKIRGEVIVAKPVLLLALIDGIDSEAFTKNEFPLTEWLESKYVMLMKMYMRNPLLGKPTNISNPYWYLQTDGFWHLKYTGSPQIKTTPSQHWLKENVEFAYFDESLWMLLQNRAWRIKLRDYIIEHKLTDDFCGLTGCRPWARDCRQDNGGESERMNG